MSRFFSVVITGVQTIVEASSVQELSVKLGSVDVSETKIASLWDKKEEAKVFARKNKSFEYIGCVEDITVNVVQARKQHEGINNALQSIQSRINTLKSGEQNRSVRAVVRSAEERIERLTMKDKMLPQRFL